MFHVGGGEHIGTGSAGDLIFQQSGRTVFGLDVGSGFRLERLRHLDQGGAETARGAELDRVGAAWSAHGHDADEERESCRGAAHHALGSLAFG